MRKFILFGFVIVSSLSFGCKDKCDISANCTDEVPLTEACLAAYTRWFYDSSSQSCVERSYSGCSAYGFATQTECLECKCNN